MVARRLLHHPALALLRRANSRPRAVTVVWHDSAERELANAGLALSHSRRLWRLERSRPGLEPWPPTAPAPILAEAASVEEFGSRVPANLAPVARFVGRETELASGTGADVVTVQVLVGSIRLGQASRPVAQLTLAGREAATVGLAHALAETVPMLPPRAGIAGEMEALVAGTAPTLRRTGTITLTSDLQVGEAFSRIIAHLTDVMLFWARAISRTEENPEPVHQMRITLRRMRSAISIFRAACGSPEALSAGAAMRNLGSILGPARDWDVFLTRLGQRVGAALPDELGLARLLQTAERRRAHAYRTLVAHLAGAEFRHLCIDLSAIAAGTGWRDGLNQTQLAAFNMPLNAFAADLLARRHRRVRRRGRHFQELDVPALHEVRLAGKRLRYASEFFAPLFMPKPAALFIRRLTILQDQLGHLTDGAAASALLAELGPISGKHAYAIGLVRGFVASDMAHNRGLLQREWKRFRKLDPFWD